MLINCDIGERGVNHPIDIELMNYVQIANIACGGHAGDRETVEFYISLAQKNGVKPTAHLSYPDIENFGRTSMNIEFNDLAKSLDRQIALMPLVKTVKFHGALYNDANIDLKLAKNLTSWLVKNSITMVVTPSDSLLSKCCREQGIKICAEAFAERRYTINMELNQLVLVPRVKDYASIKNCIEATEQSRAIIFNNKVDVYQENNNGEVEIIKHRIQADTICIHSDSVIALELVKSLRDLKA